MSVRAALIAALGGVLVASAAQADWAAPPQREVPLGGDGTRWVVQATLNGSARGNFLVDTGASVCVLGPTLAQRLRLRPGSASVTLQTANGQVSVPVVALQTVDVGGNRAYDVDAVVHNAVAPPLDGVIGLSFLNNFSYEIDPRRRMLRLR